MHHGAFERCHPTDERLPAVLSLIQDTFAFMEDRIDPPSSMKKLTSAAVAKQCETGEVWIKGTPPDACIFLSDKGKRLYVSKLAVAPNLRGQGIAKQLIELATSRAIQRGNTALELDVRIELSENRQIFEKLGFVKTREGAHAGYDRPTFITMQKPLNRLPD